MGDGATGRPYIKFGGPSPSLRISLCPWGRLRAVLANFQFRKVRENDAEVFDDT